MPKFGSLTSDQRGVHVFGHSETLLHDGLFAPMRDRIIWLISLTFAGVVTAAWIVFLAWLLARIVRGVV